MRKKGLDFLSCIKCSGNTFEIKQDTKFGSILIITCKNCNHAIQILICKVS